MLQVMNGWTDMISSIGTHNDLEDERVYFIHGPQWRGIPPKHMKVVAFNQHQLDFGADLCERSQRPEERTRVDE